MNRSFPWPVISGMTRAQALEQARYDYLLGRLRLKAAAGTLQGQDLEEINRLLARKSPG